MSGILSSLFFPHTCVGCGRWDVLVCAECRTLLSPSSYPPWRLCSLAYEETATSSSPCLPVTLRDQSRTAQYSTRTAQHPSWTAQHSARAAQHPSAGEEKQQEPEGSAHPSQEAALTGADVPHWAVGEYAGVLRRLLLAAKHRRDVNLQHLLLDVGYDLGCHVATSQLMRLALAEGTHVWVVPAPSRLRRRFAGREVALPLAVGVALAVSEQLTVRTSVIEACALRWGAGTQSGKRGEARRQGRIGAMRATCQVPADTEILFVDDIVTTGATITEMARSLQRSPLGVASLCWVTTR